MAQLTAEMLERLAARTAFVQNLARSSISSRWGFLDWELLYPWWRAPVVVRILMYADGLMLSSGLQLHYIKALLESRAYFYVEFRITTAHREIQATPSGPDKGPVKLTDLNILEDFDEIWFFGYNPAGVNVLEPKELELLDEFMTTPKSSNVPKRGGVLVTGDHLDLGHALGGNIRRAGKMRSWNICIETNRHSTLEEGPDAENKFIDLVQSDDRPQKITNRRFPFGPFLGFKRDFRPHPVMCGPDGPIDVFPDHQHEGETLEPKTEGDADWPIKNDNREEPYIIATGKTKDPDVAFKEFGVVSAYNGHNVDVGRIVADASWHHWLDVNLLGTNSPLYMGFDETPEGKAALKKIDAYFLNCGVWLAPPELQDEMRNAAWWSILWTDRVVELPIDAPLWYLGEQAIAALGQYASRCAVTDWVFNSAFNKRIPTPTLEKMFEQVQLSNIAFEQYVAGGILRQLMLQVGPSNPERPFPFEVPSDEELGRAIDDGVDEGIEALKSQLKSEAEFVSKLVANDFQL